MADMISRAAAIDAIISEAIYPDRETIDKVCEASSCKYNGWVGGIRDAINAVEEVNAVDTAPVVHGRWIDIPDKPEWDQKMCSICGDYRCCYGNYCPNCGAKMDGDSDGPSQ